MSIRRQVALEAGVSEATVSHVINKSKYVSPELERRVQNAIKKYDYHPSTIARSMVTKRSNHLAMLVNDLQNPRYAAIAEAMQKAAANYGYIVSIIDFNSFEMDNNQVMDLISRNIDGIFVATYTDDLKPALDKAMKSGIKVISAVKEFGIVLNTDYSVSLKEMMKDLKSLGHKRVAYISGYSVKESQHSKFEAFKEELHRNQMAEEEILIVDGKEPYRADFKAGYDGTKELLKRNAGMTAIFTVNDLAAIGAVTALKEEGLKVPEDISVIGCDNIDLAQYMDPPLATLDVPKEKMGYAAMDMLLKLMRKEPCDDMWISSSYIRRASVGAAKKENV